MSWWTFSRAADTDGPARPVRIEPLDVVQDAPAARAALPKGGLAAVVGTATAAILLPFVGAWEGTRNDPYRDIVGVWTVCTGETRVPMRRYSDAECAAMLDKSLAGYARPVLARNPELAGHSSQLAAAVSFAYNIGGGAYDRSSVARHFSAGRWRAACDAMLRWNMAGGRVVKGLDNRRRAERALCLRGL